MLLKFQAQGNKVQAFNGAQTHNWPIMCKTGYPLRHLNDKNSLIGMEFFDLDLQSINNGIFFLLWEIPLYWQKPDWHVFDLAGENTFVSMP